MMTCVKCKAYTEGTPNRSGIVVALCATCRPKRGRKPMPKPLCACGREKARSASQCQGCYMAGRIVLDTRLRELAWAMGEWSKNRFGPARGWEIEFLADMEKFWTQWAETKKAIDGSGRASA